MKNVYLGSLTSLVVIASSIAHADEGVYVPTLEGGVTASVGTFIVTPTSDYQDYAVFIEGSDANVQNVNPGYDWGINASLGYVFEETANSVELFFRNISTSDTTNAFGTVNFGPDSVDGDFSGDLGYELNSFDLMFSQFVNLGEVMQVRLSGGLAYVELEQNQNIGILPSDGDLVSLSSESEFKGWGPRVGIDTRYEFGEGIEGLGIVGGGSMAYYLGDLDYSLAAPEGSDLNNLQNDPGNHAVLNFRANLGLDYVYFFDNDERSTLGLEVGYLIDYYGDAAEYAVTDSDGTFSTVGSATDTTAISFAGPYVELKGVF